MSEQCAEHDRTMKEFAKQLSDVADRMEKANGQLHIKVAEIHDALIGDYDRRGIVSRLAIVEDWKAKIDTGFKWALITLVVETGTIVWALITHRMALL